MWKTKKNSVSIKIQSLLIRVSYCSFVCLILSSLFCSSLPPSFFFLFLSFQLKIGLEFMCSLSLRVSMLGWLRSNPIPWTSSRIYPFRKDRKLVALKKNIFAQKISSEAQPWFFRETLTRSLFFFYFSLSSLSVISASCLRIHRAQASVVT